MPPAAPFADSTALPTERLSNLRQAMAASGFDAWWLPSSDPHLSEYLPAHWQGRQWISGFSGSVGTLVVTHEQAGLWVDSRYWVQAEQQLEGSGIALMKLHPGQAQAPIQWLVEQLPEGATVGADGAVLSLAANRQLEAVFAPSGIVLRTDTDLLDVIWQDRPALPNAPIYEHASPYATMPRAEKLAALRTAMEHHGADWHLLSTVDDMAWLTNLRGSDVDYNPVFLAHMLIGRDRATLFVANGKLDGTLTEQLARDGFETAAYDAVSARLEALSTPGRVLVDPARMTLALTQALPDGIQVIEAFQPTTLAKSCKSSADIAHVRHAMEQDGAALCEFFSWLDEALARGEAITELTIDERLTAARAAREGFVSRSFPTIAGFNANGALPHYRATSEAHAIIEGNGLLLIDSGAQYLGGTTDITRVVPIGEITPDHRRDFTCVLKGMIALSRAAFPSGIAAPLLDSIARAPLWSAGLDYGHGTGHGVGYFLNVHEGPQVISWYAPLTPQTAMQPGMITSIEPGVYRPGQWGIRIENLVVNRSRAELMETQDDNGEFGEFLAFETLTLCPIDTRCIEASLLNNEEIDWLNGYHATVRERLAPLLDGPARYWLEESTQPIMR